MCVFARMCISFYSSAVKKAQQVGVKVKELQEELQETEIEAVAAEGEPTTSLPLVYWYSTPA